jgi:hypothetical protein
MAQAWAMPDSDMPQGPGLFRYPFQHQTLLSSYQLASYFHLPREETSGFAVTAVPAFDTVPPAVTGQAVPVGHVVERSHATANLYRIESEDLRRHVLIAGVTGAGKTVGLKCRRGPAGLDKMHVHSKRS